MGRGAGKGGQKTQTAAQAHAHGAKLRAFRGEQPDRMGEVEMLESRFWGASTAWARCEMGLYEDHVKIRKPDGDIVEYPLTLSRLVSTRPTQGRTHCFSLINTTDDSVEPRLVFAVPEQQLCGQWMRDINLNMMTKCGGLAQVYVNLV